MNPSKTILYLVRHGETVDNERQIMQGQTQGELNARGHPKAEMLRDQLCHEDIDEPKSSDLKRSIDTCRIIAEPHGKEVLTTPLLRERDWGGFTGRYIPDLKDEVWPDDIESLDALKERAGKFLAFLREQFPSPVLLQDTASPTIWHAAHYGKQK